MGLTWRKCWNASFQLSPATGPPAGAHVPPGEGQVPLLRLKAADWSRHPLPPTSGLSVNVLPFPARHIRVWPLLIPAAAPGTTAISWPYPISWPPLCPTPVFLSTEARVHSDLPTPSGLITYSPHPSPCSSQDGLLLTTGSRRSSVLIKRLVLSLPSGLDSNHFL